MRPDPLPPLVPVLVCTGAILVLSVMDAAMKSLVLTIGVYNTVLWRSILAAVLAGAGWSARGAAMPSRTVLALHARRAAVISIVIVAFFWGLARLPIAEAIALSFVAPLVALFLASILLGERIGRTVIWASLAGIAGVVVILAGRLSESAYTGDAALGSASILFSAVLYAYNLILARRQAMVAGVLEISFFQNLLLVILLGLAAPWLAVVPAREFWWAIVLSTILAMAGQMLMSWAYARAEAQYLIPTEYTAFVWAIGLGWLVFDEKLTATTLVGAVLIIAGCLAAARRRPKLASPIEASV